MLSASGTAKHSFLKLREVDLQQIPFVAAAVQAGAPFRVTDELKLCLFQLEGVAKGFGFQLAGVEQKLMCRDTEQGLGQLSDAGLQEVLYILAGQYQQGVFLSRAARFPL